MCEYFTQHTPIDGLLFHFAYPYSDISEGTLDSIERRRAAEELLELKEHYPELMNSRSYLNSVGKEKPCYPWLLVVVTADGKKQHGCMVRHIEDEDCIKCDLGCHGELSRSYDLRKNITTHR